jgi:hypothetical protein
MSPLNIIISRIKIVVLVLVIIALSITTRLFPVLVPATRITCSVSGYELEQDLRLMNLIDY